MAQHRTKHSTGSTAPQRLRQSRVMQANAEIQRHAARLEKALAEAGLKWSLHDLRDVFLWLDKDLNAHLELHELESQLKLLGVPTLEHGPFELLHTKCQERAVTFSEFIELVLGMCACMFSLCVLACPLLHFLVTLTMLIVQSSVLNYVLKPARVITRAMSMVVAYSD